MDAVKKFGKQTFLSLQVRNYRLYFIGQAISLSGTWMQAVAQSWLVLELTGSGTALGLVIALQFLPILFFGPWGGVLADRFSKRKILYFTQSASGVLALALGVLTATGAVRIWMIDVLALFLGFVNAIDNPARQTFVLEMVDKEKLPNAVSLNSTQMNLARVAGPALAGILIATVGIASCFIVNAVSYIPVLLALYMMRVKELYIATLVPRVKGQLREGFRYILSSPVLKNTLLMMAIIGTLSYEFIVSLPLLAQFTFHGGAWSYAALTGAIGAGSVIGGLINANRKKTAPSLMVRAAFLFGTTMLVAAVAPNITLALLALVLVGVFSINFLTLGNVILQLESVPEMRGRVMALWGVAFLGSTPIGGPIIGWIGEFIGPRWSLATGGLAAIAAAGLGAFAFKKERERFVPSEVEASAEIAVEEDTRIR